MRIVLSLLYNTPSYDAYFAFLSSTVISDRLWQLANTPLPILVRFVPIPIFAIPLLYKALSPMYITQSGIKNSFNLCEYEKARAPILSHLLLLPNSTFVRLLI